VLTDPASQRSSLFGINADTGTIIDYTPEFDVRNYVLSPSKQMVAFWSGNNLWLLELATNNIAYLTNVVSPGFYNTYWSEDEKVLLVVDSASYSQIDLSNNQEVPIDLDLGGLIDLR
jgi:hypothetical protein